MLIKTILELRKQGLSLRAISHNVGIPYSTLRDNLLVFFEDNEYDLFIKGIITQQLVDKCKKKAGVNIEPTMTLLIELAKDNLHSGKFSHGLENLNIAKLLAEQIDNQEALKLIEELKAQFPPS